MILHFIAFKDLIDQHKPSNDITNWCALMGINNTIMSNAVCM